MPAKKQNKPSYLKDLLLLFAIPIVIAVITACVAYLPRIAAHPTYDFIYATCRSYDCHNSFTVDDSGHVKLVLTNKNTDTKAPATSLHYYNAATDSTKDITLNQALRYQLDTSSKSPDGYRLTHEDNYSDFLFWSSSSDSGWYLKDGMKKKKIELTSSSSYYSQDIHFLGWIQK